MVGPCEFKDGFRVLVKLCCLFDPLSLWLMSCKFCEHVVRQIVAHQMCFLIGAVLFSLSAGTRRPKLMLLQRLDLNVAFHATPQPQENPYKEKRKYNRKLQRKHEMKT